MAQALIAPPSQDYLQKTLGSQLTAGTTSAATLNNTTGIQNLVGVMIIDRIDANGAETPTAREVIKFTGTSGSTVTTLTRGLAGTSDATHAVGAIVEFVPDVIWAQSMYDGLSQVVTASGGILDVTKVVDLTSSQTLTNKTISASSNTLTNVVTLTGSQTLTNKTLTAPSITTPTIIKPLMDATDPTAQTYTPSGGGTATLDLSLANEHRITMPAGNITIALSNDTNAQKFIVSILQDGSGSRTVTWFTTIKWAGGSAPTLTTTGSKRDTFGFIRTGSGTYDGFIVGQNI